MSDEMEVKEEEQKEGGLEWLRKRHRRNSITMGLFILVVGVLLLIRQMGVDIPAWVTDWPMILLVIGLLMGIKSGFRNPASFVLILVGGIYLAVRNFNVPWDLEQFIWPGALILIGLLVMIRPKKNKDNPFCPRYIENKVRYAERQYARHHRRGTREEWYKDWDEKGQESDKARGEWQEQWNSWKHNKYKNREASADRLDSTAVFCGEKRHILSKNFKGGETVTVFGGTEINLAQADMEESAVLDVVVVCGGLKLIVPPNWEVHTNMVKLFAGVDENRYPQRIEGTPKKVLVLTGTALMGGVEIRSY